jgi:hypothetical protein
MITELDLSIRPGMNADELNAKAAERARLANITGDMVASFTHLLVPLVEAQRQRGFELLDLLEAAIPTVQAKFERAEAEFFAKHNHPQEATGLPADHGVYRLNVPEVLSAVMR